MGDEYFDKLFDLLNRNVEQQEAYRKENNVLMKEQTSAIVKNTSMMEEVKIALQTKPCMVTEQKEKLNNGWEKYHVGVMKWVVLGLFILLSGVLTAIGLYSSPTIPHIIK